jgi:predicted secreted protein
MSGATTTDCLNASEYFLGTRHTVWVGAQFITPENPTLATETLTTSAVAAVGTNVSIALASATTLRYWKGQRLRFGTPGAYKVVELAANYNIGVTALVAKEVKTAIPSGNTAIEVPLLPYYSVRVTSPQVTGESKEIRNAGACDWSSKIMLKRMHTSSLSGSQTRNDPGFPILKEAACSTTKQVFVRVIKADNTAWDGNFWVTDFSHPQETDTEVSIEFSLEGDSAPDEDLEYAIK